MTPSRSILFSMANKFMLPGATAVCIDKQVLPLLSKEGLQACKDRLVQMRYEQQEGQKLLQEAKDRWIKTLSDEERDLLLNDATSSVRLKEDTYTNKLARHARVVDAISNKLLQVNEEIVKQIHKRD